MTSEIQKKTVQRICMVNELMGENAVGRRRLQYLKQVARNIGAQSYTAMKRMASRGKAANQSKD
jgi:hypothetical protein